MLGDAPGTGKGKTRKNNRAIATDERGGELPDGGLLQPF